MKIRTQILLAFFLLSFVPLTGIVMYSDLSSRQALESAYQTEASHITHQMDRRLTTIRADLDQRLAGLSAIPLGGLEEGAKPGVARIGMVDNILMAMGDAAPLVDALEFVPTPKPPTPPAVQPAQPVPNVATPEPPQIASTEVDASDQADDTEGEAKTAQADAEADTKEAELDEPIVIDLPPIKYPTFPMPADFNQRVKEITALSLELSNHSRTKEERDSIRQEMKRKQDALSAEMDEARKKFHTDMEVVNAKRHEREMLIEQRRELAQQKREAEQSRRVAERVQKDAVRAQRDAERARKAVEAQQSKTAVNATPAPVAVPQPVTRVITVRSMSPEQKKALKSKEKQAALLFGQRFNVPLHSDGKVVGQIRAQLAMDEVLKRVLGNSNEDTAEIPFAVDREGNVYTRNTNDRATLDQLGIIDAFKNKKPVPTLPNWVIAMSQHKESGLRIGVIRPFGQDLEELRRTAARNLGWGIGVIALALVGILPVANHFTRDVTSVTKGAERIAQGDLMTRVPVRSTNEFGQLATAFNKMAEDLSLQQQQIVEQERARREQDIQQRVLAMEYERKSVELEDARRFQLSMLPKHVPQHERYELAVLTQTATEVGGDYYDFHVSRDRALSVTIGDATGHGAKAGTMVTVVKTLFAGYNSATEPATFLSEAAEKIKRMELGRMAMALTLARFDRNRVTIASAGMPPMLVHRAQENRVEEVAMAATPLGTLGVDYTQLEVEVAKGDTVLLMSDGFPELQNEEGHQLGYSRAMQEFATAALSTNANDVIAQLRAAATRWHGDQPPNDDITFVVVRCRA